MTKELDQYLWLPYAVQVVPDETTERDVCYRAEHPELPGCMSHGATPEEAIQNLANARRLYIETLLQLGQPVPKPRFIADTAGTALGSEKMIWRVVGGPGDQTVPISHESELRVV
jgi:predicted RNase H-like HicB family nuclease